MKRIDNITWRLIVVDIQKKPTGNGAVNVLRPRKKANGKGQKEKDGFHANYLV
jgi:hypothetical protein